LKEEPLPSPNNKKYLILKKEKRMKRMSASPFIHWLLYRHRQIGRYYIEAGKFRTVYCIFLAIDKSKERSPSKA
jgi:hypothetical protein